MSKDGNCCSLFSSADSANMSLNSGLEAGCIHCCGPAAIAVVCCLGYGSRFLLFATRAGAYLGAFSCTCRSLCYCPAAKSMDIGVQSQSLSLLVSTDRACTNLLPFYRTGGSFGGAPCAVAVCCRLSYCGRFLLFATGTGAYLGAFSCTSRSLCYCPAAKSVGIGVQSQSLSLLASADRACTNLLPLY